MTKNEILERLKRVKSPFKKEEIRRELGLPIVTYNDITIYLLDNGNLVVRFVDLDNIRIIEEEVECIVISEYDANFDPIDSEEKLEKYESQCDYCGELDDMSGYAYFKTIKIF